MKSIFPNSFLALVTLTSLLLQPFYVLSAPGTKHEPVGVKKSTPKLAAANVAFIPQAPHFSVYSDGYTNGLPPANSLVGFNTFILSFLLTNGSIMDQAEAFVVLDDETRAQIIQEYHDAGIALMVSAFGSTDHPTTDGADPITIADNMAAFVTQYGLDGIDVDYEDFDAINSGTGSAEKWLIDFTNQLRTQLPTGQYIITHAPLAPWFTDSTERYPHGAYHAVAQAVGNSVDWWHIQYYNQGTDYEDCIPLLTNSNSDYPHTSIFEINQFSGVLFDKLVIGKPGSTSDATNGGFVDPNTLGECLAQGKDAGWNGGAMFWEYPDVTTDFIRTVRSQSWPV